MTYAVRVENEYVGLMGRYVAEGQSIIPGIPLMDIITPEGVVETIFSEGWGIVAHVEGHRVFPPSIIEREDDDEEDDSDDGETGQGRSSSGGASAVFPKGSVICHIVGRADEGSQKTGLNPRYSNALRMRKMSGVLRNG